MNILYWLSPRDLEELDSALAKIKYLVAIELRTMLLNILVAFTGFGHLWSPLGGGPYPLADLDRGVQFNWGPNFS